MMLNWKTTALGKHARFMVHRLDENNWHTEWAQVDARVLGNRLKICGTGPLWARLIVSVPASLGANGYYERNDCPSEVVAMEMFEVMGKCLQPDWLVEEVPL